MRVLVTGAASGIGRATVLRVARDAQARGTKAMVAAVDIGPSAGLDGVVEELRKLGAEALPLHGDLAAPDVPARVSTRRSSASAVSTGW
jgi:NAD(P)-dependent dehydrogenase (short-subunit alcohol dehydrogenase family)